MNKTPVSILQEMMIKKKTVPNYELIYDGGGTHDNTFTYQVSCDGFSATGTGRCKKDAKHEAAKEMLEKIAAHRAYPQLQASPAPSPVRKPLLTEATVSPKRAANMPFLNAVGTLTQLCLDNNLQVPDYEEVDDVGPPHARVFTISCIVSSFKEQGIATTKKQAKHEAAKKMLEKLEIVIEGLKITGEIDIRSDEIRLRESLANELAIEKYSTLTKLPLKKINLGIKLEDYHKYLKNTYDEDTRCEIFKQLDILDEDINNTENNITEDSVNELRVKFIEFLKPLYLTYNCTKMETVETANAKSKCLVSVEITTSPKLVALSLGDSEYQSERIGIKELIHDFRYLLM